MELELLDELEDKVDVAVNAVQELRVENDLLKEASSELKEKIRGLTRELEAAGASQDEVQQLRSRCEEFEQKLGRVRGRIEGMVGKIKALET